jgi:hypothetical protein
MYKNIKFRGCEERVMANKVRHRCVVYTALNIKAEKENEKL